jgi:hypothetical protein
MRSKARVMLFGEKQPKEGMLAEVSITYMK